MDKTIDEQNKSNGLDLITKTDTLNGKEYTKLYGGFGENMPVVTDLQIAKILKYKDGAKQCRRQILKHINYFTDDDIIDIKRGNNCSYNILNVLQEIGYAKQSITQAKQIYLLSYSGFCKFLQLSEPLSDLSKFIDNYFGYNSLKFSIIRHENCFGQLLNDTFKDICSFVTQTYSCDKYFIDFYEPNINLVVEYDEEHHDYNYDKDMIRQKGIINELGCKFIRVKKGQEIKGINEIMKYIMKGDF